MIIKHKDCQWHLGTNCGGIVRKVGFFNKAINILVCENHIKEHLWIRTLIKNGYNPEKTIERSSDYWKKEVNKCLKNGSVLSEL